MTPAPTLALKCETASGADREIDLAIYRAEFPFPCVKLSKEAQDKFDREKAPHYTASLDAAMTLVPEGYPMLVRDGYNDASGDKRPYAHIMSEIGEAYAATPALALTAAALRARAALAKEPAR